MSTIIEVSLALFLGLVWSGNTEAAPLPEKKKLTDDELAKCEAAVKEFLGKRKAEAGNLQPIKDEVVDKMFPRHGIYTLLFRQYPVGRVQPEGFSVANILVCDAAGKVQLLNNAKGLTEFYKANAPAVKGEGEVADAGRAWIRLSQELHQDGFFKFQLMDNATKVMTDLKGGMAVTVTIVVMQGGSGTLETTVSFDENGKLTAALESNKIRPGPRPICQATKLLDADPLVRRIVEQDLLIMGSSAKPYLDEQRAKASSELQKAIDRIWLRIVEAERN
jgi:hypothetical protein